jgi:hypothetical protein
MGATDEACSSADKYGVAQPSFTATRVGQKQHSAFDGKSVGDVMKHYWALLALSCASLPMPSAQAQQPLATPPVEVVPHTTHSD